MDAFYVTEVKEGRFTSRQLNRRILSFEGQECEVIVRKLRSYNTDNQRGYLFGVVMEDICEGLRKRGVPGPHGGPITEAQVYQMMCATFLLQQQVNPMTGEYINTVRGMSELTKSEASDFITQCIQWADEMQIPVREADPEWKWRMVMVDGKPQFTHRRVEKNIGPNEYGDMR